MAAGLKKEWMSSRERVLRTINHEPVDRMPIDLGFHYSTGISAFAYHNLRKYLGLPVSSIEIIDMFQFLARVDEDILKRFHCDCILLNPGWTSTHEWNPRGEYRFIIPQTAQPRLMEDGSYVMERFGRKVVMPKDGYFFDGSTFSLRDENEDEVIKSFAAEAKRLYEETDYFIMYTGYHAYFVCDRLDWLCRMITDPHLIIEENERIHKWQIEHVSKVIDAMGNYIQAIAVNSDLGCQTGPLCNPALHAELCAPFLEKFCSFVHNNSDLKIFMHSCGSIREFIPTLIECGVDILNPVQISARNMDPKELKKEFGDRITFWGGGCNTQTVLNMGTPEDVAANVKELVSIFKPGGGFVFNQVHNILGDIRPENIVAMLDTAYQESFY